MIYSFIDTSIIIQKNYDFTSSHFRRLIDLSKKNILKIISTYVSDKEIIFRINTSLSNAKSRLISGKLKYELKVLRNFDFFSILFSKDYEKIFQKCEKELIERYRDFLSKVNSIDIPIEDSSSIEVFEWYFTKKSPFGIGKKKDEFPDAFILSSLCNYSKDKGIMVYVVSNDNDMKDFCEKNESLIHIDSLEELLGIASKAEYKADIINSIKMGIDSHRSEIENTISYSIDSSDVRLVDVDGFVNDIYIANVKFKFDQILSIKSDEGIVTINGDAEFSIEANINYHDPGTSISDGTYYAIGGSGFEDHYNAHKLFEESIQVPILLEIKTDEYDKTDPNAEDYKTTKFEILKVEIADNTSIDITIFS